MRKSYRLISLICLSALSPAVAAESPNPCAERSPFETSAEFNARCPPSLQTAPPLAELLRELARQDGESDAQFRLRQNRWLEIFNNAAQRRDATYQAGTVNLSKEAYDGTRFRVKPSWRADFAPFNLPALLDVPIARKEALLLLREGAEKPLFITLQANSDGTLQATPLLAGLNQLIALQAAPEPPKPAPPPVAQAPATPRQAESVPESEYTCPYGDEAENLIQNDFSACSSFGLGVNTMAVARVKGHAEILIQRMSFNSMCQGYISRLRILVGSCDDSMNSWQKEMDRLNEITNRIMNLQ